MLGQPTVPIGGGDPLPLAPVEEGADDRAGAWYVRQLIGAANIDGGPAFHFMSGNLSYQVEHHLYPDLPSSRYQEIAPRVKDICERYGLPYNTGPFRKQWGSVQRTLVRLAFPGGKPRKKAPPYTAPAPATEGNGARNGHVEPQRAERALASFP